MRSQNYIVYHGIQILNLNLAFLGVRGKTSFKKKKRGIRRPQRKNYLKKTSLNKSLLLVGEGKKWT